MTGAGARGPRLVLGLYAAAFAAFALAPLAVVVGASLEPRELLRFPPDGLSLRWYAAALADPAFLAAARTSLLVAVLATAGALALGVPAAYGLVRHAVPGRAAAAAILNAPLFVPELVIGVTLLQLVALLPVQAPVTVLVLAHILICLPYVIRTVAAAVAGLDPAVEEAAVSLGAGRLALYGTVILPVLRPALASATLFAFLISFDNAVVSLFLVSARVTTLPISIYNYVQFNLDPAIAAISSMLMAVSVLVMAAASRLGPLDRVGS